MFVQGTVRFTQHYYKGDVGAASRDDHRDALRYNLTVIKMNTYHAAFMRHGGYVNHSRI